MSSVWSRSERYLWDTEHRDRQVKPIADAMRKPGSRLCHQMASPSCVHHVRNADMIQMNDKGRSEAATARGGAENESIVSGARPPDLMGRRRTCLLPRVAARE